MFRRSSVKRLMTKKTRRVRRVGDRGHRRARNIVPTLFWYEDPQRARDGRRRGLMASRTTAFLSDLRLLHFGRRSAARSIHCSISRVGVMA
jgi:hypothetical protein